MPLFDDQTFPSRRHFLTQCLATAGVVSGLPGVAHAAGPLAVENVTGLYPVEVAKIVTPNSAAEVAESVRGWPGQVAIGGGRFSMGGQVALRGGLHLDMRQMRHLVWLRPEERTARVQAGMRWRDLQDHLDARGLAVKTMQSYSNFTVGGSVSVNAHGRYVGHGAVGHTVRALQLVLADGSIVEASRTREPELFKAAIGGYGSVGVLTEVELDLAENVRMERSVRTVPLEDYVAHFDADVRWDSRAIMHNADLVPAAFDQAVSITWKRVPGDVPLTEPARLVARAQRYPLDQAAVWAMTELPSGHKLRTSVVHPLLLDKPAVKWLNHEASLDVAQLEPLTRAMSTYVLQDYFVPERNFLPFARGMAAVLRRREVEALNVSIRHSPADTVYLMPWAREPVFSFVLYYKQRTWKAAQDEVASWTRELIEVALMHGGRYYLPYQLHATKRQFEQTYPEVTALRRLKQRVDPGGKFSNELWRAYL